MPNSGGYEKPTQQNSRESARVAAFPPASPEQRTGAGPLGAHRLAKRAHIAQLDGTLPFPLPSQPRSPLPQPTNRSSHLLKYPMEAHRCLENKSRTIQTQHRKELWNMYVYMYIYASFKMYCHQQLILKYIYLRSLLSTLHHGTGLKTFARPLNH